MLDGTVLGNAIWTAYGQTGPCSDQLLVWGAEIVAEIKRGTFAHSSGLVTGIAPSPGGPGALTNGAATGGIITGLSGSRLAANVEAAFPFPYSSSYFVAFCTAITDYIMSAGRVSFSSGHITGTCTNLPPPPFPGIAGGLSGGSGSSGTIGSLVASALASAIKSSVGASYVTTQMTNFSNAICDHVMNNAVCSYSSGHVTATAPAGGGAITNGTGTNGAIQ